MAAVRPLTELAAKSKFPAVRVQALCALDGLKALTPSVLQAAFADTDAHVRRQAIRLSEAQVGTSPAIQKALLKLVDDPDVRYQLALSLGEWNDPRAGEALGRLAQAGMGDGWIRAAILSSAVNQPAEILKGVLAAPPKMKRPGRNDGPTHCNSGWDRTIRKCWAKCWRPWPRGRDRRLKTGSSRC